MPGSDSRTHADAPIARIELKPADTSGLTVELPDPFDTDRPIIVLRGGDTGHSL